MKTIPDNPEMNMLRKQAKDLLAGLRDRDSRSNLPSAQAELADQYGFESWTDLKTEVDRRAGNADIAAPALAAVLAQRFDLGQPSGPMRSLAPVDETGRRWMLPTTRGRFEARTLDTWWPMTTAARNVALQRAAAEAGVLLPTPLLSTAGEVVETVGGHYSSRHMSWLHSFWGVGASISPFIMSYAITAGMGWSGGYRVVGLIQAVLTFLLFATLPLWRRANQPAPRGEETEADQDEARPLTLRGAIRIPGVTMILLAFFAYCALESTSIIWSATYLAQYRGVEPATAAAFASLYLLGITAGRFLTGFIADRLGDRQLIRLGIFTTGFGIALIALPLETDVLALGGLVIAGFGSAPIYPAIIHSTPTNFGRQNSQAIIGIQMAAAYLGSTLMPPIFGVLSTWIGMWIFPLVLALLAILALVMTERLNRLVATRTPI